MSEEENETVRIPMVLSGVNDVPIVFVNWMSVSHQGTEFILTLGQYSQPVVLPSVLEFRPSETNSTPAVPGLDGSALEHEFEFNGLLVKGVLLESHGPSLALPDATPVNIERTEDGDFIVEEP